jgi:hypothetical protein
MCYGDISHGTDGYYQNYVDEQEREEMERQQEHEHGPE